MEGKIREKVHTQIPNVDGSGLLLTKSTEKLLVVRIIWV